MSVSEVGVDIDIGPGCLAQARPAALGDELKRSLNSWFAQVHRDRLPPMLDYDVQESIYRDKDGCDFCVSVRERAGICVCVYCGVVASPSLISLQQTRPAPKLQRPF